MAANGKAQEGKRRSRATLVKSDVVKEVNLFLQELPEKQKDDYSLKEAVDKLKEPLQDALSKGYTYDDLVKILAGRGIKISALTLKNYLPSGKKQTAK